MLKFNYLLRLIINKKLQHNNHYVAIVRYSDVKSLFDGERNVVYLGVNRRVNNRRQFRVNNWRFYYFCKEK